MKSDLEVNLILDFISAGLSPDETREYAYKHAVSFYDKKKYFEAHEIFESQWKKELGDKRLFIQALIQISIAMNKLFVKINLKGAYSQAKLASEKLLVLKTNQTFTLKGIAYLSYLVTNLNSLVDLLEENPADYSSYSPPKLLSNSKELFL